MRVCLRAMETRRDRMGRFKLLPVNESHRGGRVCAFTPSASRRKKNYNTIYAIYYAEWCVFAAAAAAIAGDMSVFARELYACGCVRLWLMLLLLLYCSTCCALNAYADSFVCHSIRWFMCAYEMCFWCAYVCIRTFVCVVVIQALAHGRHVPSMHNSNVLDGKVRWCFFCCLLYSWLCPSMRLVCVLCVFYYDIEITNNARQCARSHKKQ